LSGLAKRESIFLPLGKANTNLQNHTLSSELSDYN
jgi:hypothetical protein